MDVLLSPIPMILAASFAGVSLILPMLFDNFVTQKWRLNTHYTFVAIGCIVLASAYLLGMGEPQLEYAHVALKQVGITALALSVVSLFLWWRTLNRDPDIIENQQ